MARSAPALPPPFRERVYEMVRRVPPGRVTSYGDVAALIGEPRAARGVGSALNALEPDTEVPWWRVVNRAGRLTIPADQGRRALQRALLEREGVRFCPDGAVDLELAWEGPDPGASQDDHDDERTLRTDTLTS